MFKIFLKNLKLKKSVLSCVIPLNFLRLNKSKKSWKVSMLSTLDKMFFTSTPVIVTLVDLQSPLFIEKFFSVCFLMNYQTYNPLCMQKLLSLF